MKSHSSTVVRCPHSILHASFRCIVLLRSYFVFEWVLHYLWSFHKNVDFIKALFVWNCEVTHASEEVPQVTDILLWYSDVSQCLCVCLSVDICQHAYISWVGVGRYLIMQLRLLNDCISFNIPYGVVGRVLACCATDQGSNSGHVISQKCLFIIMKH